MSNDCEQRRTIHVRLSKSDFETMKRYMRPKSHEWHLYLGTKSTGIVVAPDEKYPNMYRIHWPDRPPSDIVNLTRAKEAAMNWAARAGGQDKHRLKWIAPKSDLERGPKR